MTWKIGILIAGSLFWRAIPHRERWREQFLHKDLVTAVKAPIRYERLSRSKTYTMVYAPNTPAGQAKVVACKREIASLKDVVAEAAALWAAEQSKEVQPASGELHSAHWGCVALLPNPNSKIPGHFLDEWAQRVSGERPGRNGAKSYDPTTYEVKRQSAINHRKEMSKSLSVIVQFGLAIFFIVQNALLLYICAMHSWDFHHARQTGKNTFGP